MTIQFEADVAHLHVAGGSGRRTPPPGALAATAPRRAARRRGDDLYFICIRLDKAAANPTGLQDQLTELGSNAYYRTQGSVTAGLKQSITAINDAIIGLGQGDSPLKAHLIAGVLRESYLYLIQSGTGMALVIKPGEVNKITSVEQSSQPLGVTLSPQYTLKQIEVQAEDLLVITPTAAQLWSDPTLSGLYGLTLEQAIERLQAASGRDLTGLVVKFMSEGSLVEKPKAVESFVRRGRPTKPLPKPPKRQAVPVAKASAAPRSEPVSDLLRNVRNAANRIGYFLAQQLARMVPGFVEAPKPDTYPPALLALSAALIPLFVVSIASLMYFRRGRQELFENYMAQAQAAVVSAQLKTDQAEIRADWTQANEWLTLAEDYRQNEGTAALRDTIQGAVDDLDLISRIEFLPAVSGGFGSGAVIQGIAATATDLYALDVENEIIWHAWATGRGFDIDREFDCLNGSDSIPGFINAKHIVVQEEPGALGVEGVVAIDESGTLLYCAPGRAPLTGILTPPDTGWGVIRAIHVFKDKLYVLDPGANSVWIYDAADGLFTGAPDLFFAEEVISLSQAVDIALAQDELIILYADGRIDRCRRLIEEAPDQSVRIRVECDPDPHFQDDRPGFQALNHIPGVLPTALEYSPPPEPSLYFLDILSNTVFHYSMRLVYQGQFRPSEPFEDEVTAITIGQPNDLYIASGNQIYFTQLRR